MARYIELIYSFATVSDTSLFYAQDLCRELLEVVGVAQVEIQREIVTAIPEILDDAQHNTAAVELKLVSWKISQKKSCLVGEKKKKKSARCGARTHDPGIKSPMLYRLS